MIDRQVRVKVGNRTPAYDGLHGVITAIYPDALHYNISVRLDGYSWDVSFNESELEFPNDPLPLPG